MNIIERILKKLKPYHGVSINMHYENREAWQLFLKDFNPEVKTYGKGQDSKELFDTADITVEGIDIHAYGPYMPNPNFDYQVAEKRRRELQRESDLWSCFKQEFEKNPQVQPPLYEGLKQDCQFSLLLNQSGAGRLEDVLLIFIDKLRENGWKIAENSDTPQKILEKGVPLMIVQPPNSDLWQLRSFFLKPSANP